MITLVLSAGMFVGGITVQMRLSTILDLGIQKLRTVIIHQSRGLVLMDTTWKVVLAHALVWLAVGVGGVLRLWGWRWRRWLRRATGRPRWSALIHVETPRWSWGRSWRPGVPGSHSISTWRRPWVLLGSYGWSWLWNTTITIPIRVMGYAHSRVLWSRISRNLPPKRGRFSLAVLLGVHPTGDRGWAVARWTVSAWKLCGVIGLSIPGGVIGPRVWGSSCPWASGVWGAVSPICVRIQTLEKAKLGEKRWMSTRAEMPSLWELWEERRWVTNESINYLSDPLKVFLYYYCIYILNSDYHFRVRVITIGRYIVMKDEVMALEQCFSTFFIRTPDNYT